MATARLDAAAGAYVVLAATIKPSLAIVAPIVVLGGTRRPWALAGLAGACVVAALADLEAFGGAVPDLGTQASLVTPLRCRTCSGWRTATAGRTRRCARPRA